jgi:hypothetical protein
MMGISDVERIGPAPARQPAKVRRTVVLLLQLLTLVGPTVVLAGFAFMAVISVLHPDRFPRFSFPLALVLTLVYIVRTAYAARKFARRRGTLLRKDDHTDQNAENIQEPAIYNRQSRGSRDETGELTDHAEVPSAPGEDVTAQKRRLTLRIFAGCGIAVSGIVPLYYSTVGAPAGLAAVWQVALIVVAGGAMVGGAAYISHNARLLRKISNDPGIN